MKIQALLSAACVLLTAVPNALAEVSYICIAMYKPSDISHMMSYHETYHASYVYDSFCTLYCSSITISRYLSLSSTIVYTLYNRSNHMPLPSPSKPSRMSLSPPVCMIQFANHQQFEPCSQNAATDSSSKQWTPHWPT